MSREYLHEALLRTAMLERGEDPGPTRANHPGGTVHLTDGRTFGLVYPDSFFARSAALMDTPKDVRFVFRGKMFPGRAAILNTFKARWPDALIEETDAGRRAASGGGWDAEYWGLLARAEFGLCPHQPDFMYGRHARYNFPLHTLWTYRFVECCMVGAIPVLFRETPLSPAFTDRFHVTWDDDDTFEYDPAHAAHNRTLAETRFRLP